jgi:flagellin-specific chaperone FliS
MNTMSEISNYRTAVFDGATGIGWLFQGWRALRLYGRRAKAAMEAGDVITKVDMISRADRLLTVMSGIVDTGAGSNLGRSLQTIYSALRFCLFKANAEGDIEALNDYEKALSQLDRDFSGDAKRIPA